MMHRKWECRYHLEVVISFPLHFLWFLSFFMPRSGIAGSHGSSVFIFLRNFRTIFYYGYTSILSHQQYRSVLIFPHPLEHLLSLIFFIIVLLTGVMWYLFLVLICISLMISDILNIFSYNRLAICVSSLEKYIFRSFSQFIVRFFVCLFCYWVLGVPYIYFRY